MIDWIKYKYQRYNPAIRKVTRFVLAYFLFILLLGQTVANIIRVSWPEFYFSGSFKFWTDFQVGINLWVIGFFMFYAFGLKFCYPARAAAVTELLFAIFYAIIKEDNMYNVIFQLIVGGMGIIVTLYVIYKKYPLCSFSLWVKFFLKALPKSNCNTYKAVEKFDEMIWHEVKKRNGVSV
jgi:hypothetical protein